MAFSARTGSLWGASLAVALMMFTGTAHARTTDINFTDLRAPLTGVYSSSAALGDYDNDGDLDILLTGDNSASSFTDPVAKVFRNHAGTFTDTQAGLAGVYDGSAAWGDYDNDGDLDILLSGLNAGGTAVSKVYRNDGGAFRDAQAALTGVYGGSAAWGDYDNDGDLDILLTGQRDRKNGFCAIYRNDGGGVFTSGPRLAPAQRSSAAWGDYDNDGDLDILLAGWVDRKGGFSAVYRNDGNRFREIAAGLAGVWESGVAWGDYDNDGDPDILLTGRDAANLPISKVYRNDGNNVFTDINAGMKGVSDSSVAWSDYDNDGYLDILLTGRDAYGFALSDVYWNDCGAGFLLANQLSGVADSGVASGDYDNDGDSDILLTGSLEAKLYRNERVVNGAPLANAGGPYSVECSSSTVRLDGSASFDADGDALTFLWTAAQEAARFDDPTSSMPTLDVSGAPLGTPIAVTLTVGDGISTSQATATVTVVDTTAPEIVCPADIIQEPTALEGNAVTYAPVATDTCGSPVDLVCDPPSGSTFATGSTTTVVCTATDGAGNRAQSSFTVTILPAQGSGAPVLWPGGGWTGPTPQPDSTGTGPGADAKAIARWDVVPYQTVAGTFEIGVVAFHMNGIDRVEFAVDNGPWVAVREMTLNPRTGIKEYWATLSCDALPDGPIEVRAIAYPTTGVPRVLAGDNVQIASGEHSMFLFANGSLNFVPAQVFVGKSGSDQHPGTRELPLLTIARGLDVVPDGGEVVLLDAGIYLFPQRSTTSKRFNERWITVRPDASLPVDSVTIGTPQFTSVRPEIARIRWKGVCFDLNQIDYFNQNAPIGGSYHLWFDECLWFDALGWLNRTTRSLIVRGGRYYATDSRVYDTLYGFANATLVRGGNCRHISGDVFQNSHAVFGCDVTEVGGALPTFHSDLYQNYGAADNVIVYALQASGLSSTQAFLLQPTYQSTQGSPRYAMTNSAFVEIDIRNVRVFQGDVDWGGPPWSQLQSKLDHILFRDVWLPYQRMVVRDDLTADKTNQWWEGRNIVFQRVGFHPLTWSVYSNQAQWPSGVSFDECYSAQ